MITINVHVRNRTGDFSVTKQEGFRLPAFTRAGELNPLTYLSNSYTYNFCLYSS